LIEQAIDIIRETGKASTTQLQRKLNIGFARAGRVMDELEQR
jgi:S-DNA-T family DNA segregation ATPase FtsK/SpoIIIE